MPDNNENTNDNRTLVTNVATNVTLQDFVDALEGIRVDLSQPVNLSVSIDDLDTAPAIEQPASDREVIIENLNIDYTFDSSTELTLSLYHHLRLLLLRVIENGYGNRFESIECPSRRTYKILRVLVSPDSELADVTFRYIGEAIIQRPQYTVHLGNQRQPAVYRFARSDYFYVSGGWAINRQAVREANNDDELIENLNYEKMKNNKIKDFEGNLVDSTLAVNSVIGVINKKDPRFFEDALKSNYYLTDDKELIRAYGISAKTIMLRINFDSEGVSHGNLKTHERRIHLAPAVYNPKNHRTEFYTTYEETLTPNFKKFYVEDLYTGNFVHKEYANILQPFEKSMKINGIEFNHSFDKFLKDHIDKPMTYKSTLGKKYQFGIELETISGLVPMYVMNKLYCSSVHDGSLRQPDDNQAYGKEYVTCVLQGDAGMKALQNICYETSLRTLVNYKCGVHTHISGPVFNKETIVLMYMVYQAIQNEIFTLLPISRRNNEYCRPIKQMNLKLSLLKQDRYKYFPLYYADIIKFLSGTTRPTGDVNKSKNHPKGNKCGYDHNTARYCWVNFIPSVFNTRKNGTYTIEFRPMSGTTSYYKIKNWTLLCMALVDFVENYKSYIYSLDTLGNITLDTIVDVVYGAKGAKLKAWINKRKDRFNINSLPKEDLDKNETIDYLEGDLEKINSIKNL